MSSIDAGVALPPITRISVPRTIRSVGIKLTDVCNVNCIMCGQRVREEGVWIKNFVDEEKLKQFFATIPTGTSVYLWGGEPLLHPRFRSIAAFFVEKKTKVVLNTNGFLLSKHIDFLNELPLETLIVSLDGLETLHDQIRRQPGLFRRATMALRKYVSVRRRRRLPEGVVVNFTLIPENHLELERFVREVKTWGVTSVTVNLPILVDSAATERFADEKKLSAGWKLTSWRGYATKYRDAFDYDRLSRICERVADVHGHFVRWSNERVPLSPQNLKTYYERPDVPLEGIRTGPWKAQHKPCAMLTKGLAIDANGNVVQCPDFPDTVIGNIGANRLEDFISDAPFHRFGLYDEVSPMCLRCPYRP